MVEIVLEDLQPEIFGYILGELYGVPQTDIPNEHVVGVLLAAGRFLLEPLRMRCVQQLVVSMDRETVWQLFSEVVPLVAVDSMADPAAAALETACACFLINELALTAPVRPALRPPEPPNRAERRARDDGVVVEGLAGGLVGAAAAAAAITEEAQAIADRRAWEELVADEEKRVLTAEGDARKTVAWFAEQLTGAEGEGRRATDGMAPWTGELPAEKLAEMVAGLQRSIGGMLNTRMNPISARDAIVKEMADRLAAADAAAAAAGADP